MEPFAMDVDATAPKPTSRFVGIFIVPLKDGPEHESDFVSPPAPHWTFPLSAALSDSAPNSFSSHIYRNDNGFNSNLSLDGKSHAFFEPQTELKPWGFDKPPFPCVSLVSVSVPVPSTPCLPIICSISNVSSPSAPSVSLLSPLFPLPLLCSHHPSVQLFFRCSFPSPSPFVFPFLYAFIFCVY